MSSQYHPTLGNQLLEDALRDAPKNQGNPLALVEWFRRRLDPDLARWAAEQVGLIERAKRRFPDAERWRWTAKGLEQATRPRLAARRAERLRERLGAGAWIADLTCGLGSDSRAMAAADLRPLALERDPETALAALHNLQGAGGPPGFRGGVLRADAEQPPLGIGLPWMADPDRRAEASGARRSLDPQAWSPPWSAFRERWQQSADSVLKLAPATEVAELGPWLPADLPRTWRWVGEGRELLEVGLWTGVLADPVARIAERWNAGDGWRELHDDGGPREIEALGSDAATGTPVVAEPHSSALRAGLLGVLCRRHGLAPLGPGLAFLGLQTSGESSDSGSAEPFLNCWRVLGGAALNPKKVRRLLRERNVGPVQVKARGVGRSNQELERELRGSGEHPGQLLVARLGDRRWVYLVEPLR